MLLCIITELKSDIYFLLWITSVIYIWTQLLLYFCVLSFISASVHNQVWESSIQQYMLVQFWACSCQISVLWNVYLFGHKSYPCSAVLVMACMQKRSSKAQYIMVIIIYTFREIVSGRCVCFHCVFLLINCVITFSRCFVGRIVRCICPIVSHCYSLTHPYIGALLCWCTRTVFYITGHSFRMKQMSTYSKKSIIAAPSQVDTLSKESKKPRERNNSMQEYMC